MKKTVVTQKGFYSNLKCIKKLVISQNFHAINVADVASWQRTVRRKGQGEQLEKGWGTLL